MKKIISLAAALVILFSISGCTKQCRCIGYDADIDYYTKEELAALKKDCDEMRYMNGLATQRYALCEWVYGE